jgi:serine/threonine-protein kinase RsbW
VTGHVYRPTTGTSNAEAPGLRAVPGGHMNSMAATLELSLAPTAAAPGMARAAIADWLAHGIHDAATNDNARLLVTELVSNGVRHARIEAAQPLRLRAWLREATLHIELWDAGTDGAVAPGPARIADDAGAGGFGLNLVAELSSDWGVERSATGTTVWLELPTAPDATT